MKCCKCGSSGFDKTFELANPESGRNGPWICEECATAAKVKEVNPLFRVMQKLLDEKGELK